jgi:hypothetical protein
VADWQVRQEHRKVLVKHLEQVHHHLLQMFGYWMEHDLPSDILAEDEYPFTLSLDDLLAEVQDAIEKVHSRHDIEEQRMADPILTFVKDVAELKRDGDLLEDDTPFKLDEENAWSELTRLIGIARALVHSPQRHSEGVSMELDLSQLQGGEGDDDRSTDRSAGSPAREPDDR